MRSLSYSSSIWLFCFFNLVIWYSCTSNDSVPVGEQRPDDNMLTVEELVYNQRLQQSMLLVKMALLQTDLDQLSNRLREDSPMSVKQTHNWIINHQLPLEQTEFQKEIERFDLSLQRYQYLIDSVLEEDREKSSSLFPLNRRIDSLKTLLQSSRELLSENETSKREE